MTRELLRLMPDDGTLLTFEISARFVTYLRETIPDPRLQIVQASAETAAMELSRRGIEQVDGVVSSLGISFMAWGRWTRSSVLSCPTWARKARSPSSNMSQPHGAPWLAYSVFRCGQL